MAFHVYSERRAKASILLRFMEQFPPSSNPPSIPFSFPFPQIQLGGLGRAVSFPNWIWDKGPVEIEFCAFYVKNLASGEYNNFSDVQEEL